MKKVKIDEIYKAVECLCNSCGIDSNIFYYVGLDMYYCGPCSEDEEVEIEEEPTYNEICAERHGGYKL